MRQMVGSMLSADGALSTAARRKLEEALVRVMERAFVSGWWKDPIGDLLLDGNTSNNFLLLSLIPDISTDTSKAYAWHHEIKAHSAQVIETISTHLQSQQTIDTSLLDCIKNWTAFGAFSFPQVERILPALISRFESSDCEEVEGIVDCLVEIGELVTRDAAEEARKARHLIPVCLSLSKLYDLDPQIVTKLSASLTEECASFLVQTCHDPQTQQFLGLLLKLTAAEGLVGVDDCTSSMTLNAWYLLTEALDTDMDSQIPESNRSILVSLLGQSLVPILLQKSTLPAPQTWSELQRDLQQQFMQLRRDFLDTLLYIQRALKTLQRPWLILQIVHADLLKTTEKTQIEVRLRALMIIAEESADSSEENAWSPEWQSLASLIFTSPEITKDAINAKLAISLIGSLLPLMARSPASNEAVKMLLAQLQGNALVREECLGALQQAADAEVALLTDPQVLANLIAFLTTQKDPELRIKLIKLISRLVSDLSDESQRWSAFNTLIGSCSCTDELALVLKSPFTYETISISDSPYLFTLANLKSTVSISSGEALLAAWLALSGSIHFPTVEGNSDPWPLTSAYLNCPDDALVVLGAKLQAAWVYGMARVNSPACFQLLESASRRIIDTASPEEAIEAILDAWINFLKHRAKDCNILNSSSMQSLFQWTLQRIANGQLSVPLLRSLARFLCALIEFPELLQPQHLANVLEIILSVGVSGKIGRCGIEILARVAHDISLQHAAFFPQTLARIVNSSDSTNAADKRAFLMNLGAAHTIKKFKTVLVDFCLQSRGI